MRLVLIFDAGDDDDDADGDGEANDNDDNASLEVEHDDKVAASSVIKCVGGGEEWTGEGVALILLLPLLLLLLLLCIVSGQCIWR